MGAQQYNFVLFDGAQQKVNYLCIMRINWCLVWFLYKTSHNLKL